MIERNLEMPDVLQLARMLSGKLLLKDEIPLTEACFERLLTKNLLTAVSSIESSLFTNRCVRCFNQNRSLFGHIPCKRCGQTHVYCRSCIEMGRILACEPLYHWTGPEPAWPERIQPCTWTGRLTAQQQNAANKTVSLIQKGSGKLLLWAVCGAGKTEMLFPGIAAALEKGMRICLASPRADVVRELKPRFEQAFSDTEMEALYGGSPDRAGQSQLILATTHQLLRFKSAFDVLIIDEVDAFPYHRDKKLPLAAKRAGKPNGAVIYLTATPRKEHTLQIRTGNLPHHFIPCRFHGHPLPVPRTILSVFLQKRLNAHLPPTHFFTWLSGRDQPNRQLLVFVPTIRLAERMKEALLPILLDAQLIADASALQSVHAEDADREEKVQAFRNRNIHMLITTTILERGVTFPSVDVVVIDAGHHVFDEAALVQIAGRAGRSPDDPEGEVLFYHDGRTNAMEAAIRSIKAMNRRAGF